MVLVKFLSAIPRPLFDREDSSQPPQAVCDAWLRDQCQGGDEGEVVLGGVDGSWVQGLGALPEGNENDLPSCGCVTITCKIPPLLLEAGGLGGTLLLKWESENRECGFHILASGKTKNRAGYKDVRAVLCYRPDNDNSSELRLV